MKKILAIAIDQYSDLNIKNLSNCLNDVNSLIDILSQRYDFEEIELITKPEQTTRSFLYNVLYQELINLLPEDEILIIYAGHGEYNSLLETSYWLCSDSQKDIVSTWFNVIELLSFFKGSKARHIALISDSCFSGAVFEHSRGGGIAALYNKTSRQALTSGGIEKVSDGVENSNSPFNLTLQRVLNENTSLTLSFAEFAEKVILNFRPDKVQTPAYGSLASSGDKGGTLFFHLKNDKVLSPYKSIQIPLDIDIQVKVDSNFEIPFFNDSEDFKSQFVNIFVQQLGYSIINDIRNFVAEDREYSISYSNELAFYLDVSYTIETFSKEFLSIVIQRSNYFGGVHPNHYIYTLNFMFEPDRLVQLFDVISFEGYQNQEEYLKSMVKKYAYPETKEFMLDYTSYEYIYKLDFSISEEFLTIYYFNLMPHAFKASGILQIPIQDINFKAKFQQGHL
ncbi:caspase family protein [Mucilaginibacter sp. JRF]|uniref:caspase family protein n=1 Tax=Mucilaginibacter sp. JRF TaxID=2780088 RepID=UPI00187E079C|nr:caspase family protein [Mucilaginibacter sp. JRF]MBE9586655.1 caspase family protein [Mucilaginibacter sp. JRF]